MTPRRPRPNERMKIGATIFNVLFNHKMSRVDALSELIDNAFGPAAGNASSCLIQFRKNKVEIYDNGVGVRDLNAIMTPGESGSRSHAEDIGSYGIGAKYGMFHFGKTVEIDTTRNGLRHRHMIDFDAAQRINEMPLLYRGRGDPTSRPSGTCITITNLHEGRHSPAYKFICEALSHRYLLARRAKRKIFVSWPEQKEPIELQGDDVVALYEQGVAQHTGTINNKPFTVVAGNLREFNPTLHGLHIGYGFRFIMRLSELAGVALPPLFYGRVILGNEWKTSLSPDKTAITTDHEALETAVYELLKDWIDELRKKAEEYRNKQIRARLAESMEAIFRLAKEDGGDYLEGDGIETHPEHGDDPNPDPEPDLIDALEAIKRPEGRKKANPDKNKSTGIRFKFDRLGEHSSYFISVDNDGVEITLNLDIPLIQRAYDAPFKLSVIWGIGACALAAQFAADFNLAKRMLIDQSVLDSLEDSDAVQAICNAISRITAHLFKAEPDPRQFTEESLDKRPRMAH